jgi:hypothetical protein
MRPGIEPTIIWFTSLIPHQWTPLPLWWMLAASATIRSPGEFSQCFEGDYTYDHGHWTFYFEEGDLA